MAESYFQFYSRVKRRSSAGKPPADPPSAPADAAAPLTVSQLTTLVERAMRTLPQRLVVRGEVSNLSHHQASGHLYFTLKDPSACVECVMFRSDAVRLKFAPRDGIELLATGQLRVYRERGRYQLYVTRLEPLGQGALELALREIRGKLEAEGLFAPERKRPLPPYPQRLVLVTSRETAALQDMLKVLGSYPWVRVMLYHVPVQGEGAAAQIAQALLDINRRAASLGIEVIVLARGGGSLEDLWQFNEEVLARAVAASNVPVVTGIGHEIDVSIADLVADYHAHTPTEAAQVVMRNWRTARDVVDAAGIRLRREMRNMVQQARQRLVAAERCELFRRPLDRINALRQLTDDRQRALRLALSGRVGGTSRRLGELEAFLREHHPRHMVRLAGRAVQALGDRMTTAMRTTLSRYRRWVDATDAHLGAVGPEQVLRRGYSITMLRKTRRIVRSPAQVRPGDRLVTRLSEGEIESTADDPSQLRLFE